MSLASARLRALSGGFRLGLRTLRSTGDYLMPLAVVPFTTLVLVTVFAHGGRRDLSGTAFLAPALMGLWAMSLYVAGETVDSDRSVGILEPAPAAHVVNQDGFEGRIAAFDIAQ